MLAKKTLHAFLGNRIFGNVPFSGHVPFPAGFPGGRRKLQEIPAGNFLHFLQEMHFLQDSSQVVLKMPGAGNPGPKTKNHPYPPGTNGLPPERVFLKRSREAASIPHVVVADCGVRVTQISERYFSWSGFPAISCRKFPAGNIFAGISCRNSSQGIFREPGAGTPGVCL